MDGNISTFTDLDTLATELRKKLSTKKYLLLFAYNGVGKTRLSMAFKETGKQGGGRDTLYFNAYTEDLFVWDNDLDNDSQRVLTLNRNSKFFSGLAELEMDTRIRPFLQRYADFDFRIDFVKGKKKWTITFFRDERVKQEDGSYKTIRSDNIKISRGEERIFVWCFFLAIAQLAMDGQDTYDWVKYIYIDDPISSLDDNNAITVASHLAQLLKDQNRVKIVLSSHHTLFFNVMCNELGKALKFYLNKGEEMRSYALRKMFGDTARFYHVAMLKEIKLAADSGNLYTYHFSILRNLLEKTAYFHGFTNFGNCLTRDAGDADSVIKKRIISLLNHGDYSIFEPVEMLPENKEHFRDIINDFLRAYKFNPEIFPEQISESQS